MTLLCLAAIWLSGFSLLRWLFPRTLRWSLHNVWLFSLGIGTGAGVASCLYFLALVLAGPSLAVLAAITGAAVLIAITLGFVTKRMGTLLDWETGPAPPWYLTAAFGLAIALAAIMFLGAVSYHPQGEEGAWSIWNLRARFLVRAGVFWRDAFSAGLAWSHPDYPLLVPALVALCWKLTGGESINAPTAIAFLFALGTAGVLVTTLGTLRGKTQALLAGTLLLATASFIALSAALYGDVPLGFYILAALAMFCLQDRHPENLRFSALAGLMAGFAAWTRNEGIIFVAAAIVARMVALLRYRVRAPWVSQLLHFAAGLASPLAIFVYFKLFVAAPSGVFSLPLSSILKHLVDPSRWIITVQGLVIALFTLGRFLIPIVLVLGLYWYLVRFRVEARDRTALATAAIALALTLAIQLLIDILFVDNLADEISTSFERALLQLWPGAVLVFFLALGPLQLVNTEKTARKAKLPKKPARRAAETR